MPPSLKLVCERNIAPQALHRHGGLAGPLLNQRAAAMLRFALAASLLLAAVGMAGRLQVSLTCLPTQLPVRSFDFQLAASS